MMVIFFSPLNVSEYTVGLTNINVSLFHWLGMEDPSLEMLSLRFTTNDKSPDAIRELACYRGINLIRMVRVMKNPKWELCLLGEPQPFEDDMCFNAVKGKQVKNYFTMDDMMRFACNWGCPISKEEFWNSNKDVYIWGNSEE